MSERLFDRITDQFSYRSERADIWRVLDLILNTDAFLNLGYSEWYQPHFVGSCQRRLATEIGKTLLTHLPRRKDAHVLDVGCGRGGPTLHLADSFGFRVTGIDLVPYNIARAREKVKGRAVDANFMVGDATRLPLKPDSLIGCVGIDSFVYLPNRKAAFEEIADILESGGVLVFSDLVARTDVDESELRKVEMFAESWDMPALGSSSEYVEILESVGIDVLTIEDISPHSVSRFRKWTGIFYWLSRTLGGDVIDRVLAKRGLDADTIMEQIHRAHEALPALQHILVVGRK